jgi:hypothetical protein
MKSVGFAAMASIAIGAISKAFVAPPGYRQPKRVNPKGTLVPDPRNKRGRFNKPGRNRSQPLRLEHPPVQPNCRAEYADRVLVGKTAFIYPNVRPDWR